jgi:hypothetical protein
MNGSFLGLTLINRWYIPCVNPDKLIVHSLGRRVERNMRLWWEVLLELLNCIICISKYCDVNLHI